jgi:hypothetical protein
MISGIFHSGSGVGNQLHRYVAARVLAKDKGYEFGMQNPTLFKGQEWMKLDTGKLLDPDVQYGNWNEQEVRTQSGLDIRSYDPEINFVQDNTIIDGEFQDPRYFEHRLDEIDEWLKVEPMDVPDDVCVIGFRGGEYKLFPDLFLDKSYWTKALLAVKLEHPDMKFEVHTDDPEEAKKFFPEFPIIHDVAKNWRAMRYAKYAIIANSSFYILPRLLSKGITYAPRYWARRNTKTWALPQNYYREFTYL